MSVANYIVYFFKFCFCILLCITTLIKINQYLLQPLTLTYIIVIDDPYIKIDLIFFQSTIIIFHYILYLMLTKCFVMSKRDKMLRFYKLKSNPRHVYARNVRWQGDHLSQHVQSLLHKLLQTLCYNSTKIFHHSTCKDCLTNRVV